MEIGRRIYYDVTSGEVIANTGERSGNVVLTTVEYDISVYIALSERKRETFDHIELKYGQYAEDFATCNGYRVNPATKKLVFSYPDPNKPEPEQPSRKPLTEEVDELKSNHENLVKQLSDKGVI